MNINKVTLAGRLTRDPELKYLPNGTPVARICVAINKKWQTKDGEKKESTLFVDVDAWRKNAEHLSQYFSKGSDIYLEGALKLDTWEDKQTKQPRQKMGVILESFQFVGKAVKRDQPPSKPESAPADDGQPELPASEKGDDIPF